MTNVVKLLLISASNKRTIWPSQENSVMQNVPSGKKKLSAKRKSDRVDKEKGKCYNNNNMLKYPCSCRVAMAPVDPYKQQKILINTLTNYLNRLTLKTVSVLNNSSSIDTSGDEVTQLKWDADQPQEGSFLQKKVDHDDKTTSGGGKRKSKRDRKKANAVNKVRTVSDV